MEDKKPKDIPSLYLDDLYESRIILMLERGPQTNKYRQIMLTPARFKRIMDAIAKEYGIDDKSFMFNVSEKVTTDLPDEVKTFYSEEEIENDASRDDDEENPDLSTTLDR